MDMGYSGPEFTWTNLREGDQCIQERLDRVWATRQWQLNFPSAQVHHLPRTHSDHNPICVQVQSDVRVWPKPPYRFLLAWLEHGEFEEFVRVSWDGGENINEILEAFRASSQRWNWEVFGNIFQRKDRCLRRLSGIQRAICVAPSTYLKNLETQLQEEYDEALKFEELYWLQKSNLQWFVHGKRNTRFFHLVSVCRRRRNSVRRLMVDGEWCEDQNVLRKEVNDFYTKLYTAEGVTKFPTDYISFNRISKNDKRRLNRDALRKETEDALFQLGALKAPGPDGIPPAFYQKYWHIVGHDVYKFVELAFRNKEFDSRLNNVLLTLIPKQDVPRTISHFRPISLYNTLVKVISKVIANRLKGMLPLLIGETRCSFIPGRQGVDNIVIAQEMIHTFRKKRGRHGYMAIKIDLEKAYDRVDWSYLGGILDRVGFDKNMIKLIMFCLKSASLRVIWNGDQLEEIKPTRGLRQGDPLAPYLFVLCMEPLNQLILDSVGAGDWKAVKVYRRGPQISHLLFADDIILYGEASTRQAETMRRIIQTFCGWSDQRVNTKKSSVFFSPNTDDTTRNILCGQLGMQSEDRFGKYLGTPIIQGRVTKSTFAEIVSKVRTKLQTWKMRVMSRTARLILIQSVISTIPYYYMQTGKIPESTVKELEKLNRDFLWGDSDGQKRIYPLAWKLVCRPKDCGGLGVRRLTDMNNALLIKLGWRMMHHKNSLWARVLWAKYGSPTQRSRTPNNSSYTWRSIRHALQILNEDELKRLHFDEIDDETRDTHQDENFEIYHFSTTDAYEMTRKISNDSRMSHWSKI